MDRHLERRSQLRELVHAVEATVAAQRRPVVVAVDGFGGALGKMRFSDPHDANDEGREARDAGADDAEAGFDPSPDCDVDGEAWEGGGG